MDPIAAGPGANQSPNASAVYDRLVYIDPVTGSLIPGLALSLTANENATVWTMKLRRDVKFTDGTPFDADAVKANWDRVAATPTATDRTIVQGFTRYEVVDPLTVRVTLPSPRGGLPASLQNSLGLIASPTALQKYGAAYGSTPESTVGAGPFKMTEWLRGDHMRLERNPSYWQKGKPYLDALIVKPVADPNQKASALQTKQADLAWLPTITSADKTLIDSGFNYIGIPQDGGIDIAYNVSKAPFNDARVRQALTLALDLNDLNQKAALGLASMVDTYAPKNSAIYDPAVRQKTNNLAQAQKLIDAYVADNGGKPVSFSLLYAAGSLQAWGEATMQQWAKLKNVNVTADMQQPTVANQRGQTGQFDAWYGSITLGRHPQFPEAYYAVFHSGETTNIQHIADPALDKVLEAGRAAVSVSDRKAAISKITSVLMDQSVATLIYRLQIRTYYGKNVRGVVAQDVNLPDIRSMWLASS
jgi:ABC-type transport system substrate-binding protein